MLLDAARLPLHFADLPLHNSAQTRSYQDELDAAILFAPVGSLVPQALRVVACGGIVDCAGIHMSDIPSFPYHLLWGARTVRSVANLTRRDGEDFLALAPLVPVQAEVETLALNDANEALNRLRLGQVRALRCW